MDITLTEDDTQNEAGPYSIGSNVWNGMSKLIEEMGELNQVLGKLMGSDGNVDHWSGDLTEKLVEECGDVTAALNFFVSKNLSEENQERTLDQAMRKYELFEEWNRDKE